MSDRTCYRPTATSDQASLYCPCSLNISWPLTVCDNGSLLFDGNPCSPASDYNCTAQRLRRCLPRSHQEATIQPVPSPSQASKPCRKRRYCPKVFTGCLTCKQRRVKCDGKLTLYSRLVSTTLSICSSWDNICLVTFLIPECRRFKLRPVLTLAQKPSPSVRGARKPAECVMVTISVKLGCSSPLGQRLQTQPTKAHQCQRASQSIKGHTSNGGRSSTSLKRLLL